MPEKVLSRTARTAPSRGAAARRRELRKAIERREGNLLRDLAHNPQAGSSLLIALCFAILVGAIAAFAHQNPRIMPGRTAPDSRLVRAEFRQENEIATQSRRELERQRAPRVYNADQAIFEELESSLSRLPRSLAAANTLDEVALEIRTLFNLDDASFQAIRAQAEGDGVSQRWTTSVRDFMRDYQRSPVLAADVYQVEDITPNDRVLLSVAGSKIPVAKDRAININNSERLREELRRLASRAGFEQAAIRPIVDRIARIQRPNYVYNEAATQAEREAAAAAVRPEFLEFKRGDVLVRRGDRVDATTAQRLYAERDAFSQVIATESPAIPYLRALAAIAIVAVATAGASLYLALFYPPAERRPSRLLLLAIVGASCFAIALWGATVAPTALFLVATLPTLFFGTVVVIVYDQRCALLLMGLHAALVAATLQLPLSFAIAILAVGSTLIAQLAEIRQRTTLIRAGAVTAIAAFIVTLVVGFYDRSLFDPSAEGFITPARRELLMDAALFAGSSVLVAFFTLGLLPAIEHAFDVLTGMRLIELRDPKQPLLRRLAQRAPGTYTHSITVAALAESAADAVGADALHVYVGALYHDIGKMNKPDYFVENQGGGFNRHTKLSPAMSLLVIVGHVKDGNEMAIEEGLPRSLRHYIESHHGTTLVEYFYHRAKEQAEENREDAPAEVGYRYPGPKPQTKEAAILMLCDAVESATRALAEPTPSRIESVVRTLSLKRLMDGQFDESDLTLRELQVIEDAVIKSLNSIYHGRIAYPGGPMTGEKDRTRTSAKTQPLPQASSSATPGMPPPATSPAPGDPNASKAHRAAGA